MRAPILLLALLCLSSVSRAEEPLTAVPLRDVLDQFERTELTPKGHGLLFGFVSIESCVYAGEDLLVLFHYCHPKRNYPAKGVSLWSKRFGIIELYEEILSEKITERVVRINQFPEYARAVFSMDFRDIDVDGINGVSRKLYDRWNPACWSTNFDRNAFTPVADCYKTDVSFYPEWVPETQSLVNDPARWSELWERVRIKLGR